ncbi:hypothetical protein, partial [Spirosoma spitsbergense]|uniref:hypothetical protein n=1 Tax=Spirosoma spitsbergense TaxID=431554 RepID=UPI001B7FEC58
KPLSKWKRYSVTSQALKNNLMAVSAPPKKKAVPASITDQPTVKGQERKIDEIINRGSTTIGKAEQQEQVKNFNIKIMSGQLAAVDQLRAKRPRKPTSPKLGVSLQDWIIEAIEEKVEREKKKYNLGV